MMVVLLLPFQPFTLDYSDVNSILENVNRHNYSEGRGPATGGDSEFIYQEDRNWDPAGDLWEVIRCAAGHDR